MAWAWKLKVPAGPKAVLLSFADEAGDEGMLPWPSMAALRVRTSLTAKDVRQSIAWLERAGLLRCTYAAGADVPDLAHLVLNETSPRAARKHRLRP